MIKIAIQGHRTRGKEVIQILESLGGQNIHAYWGHSGNSIYYYINKHCKIVYDSIHVLSLYDYKLYTLEEFEKEFPFKIGDKVMGCSDDEIGIILGFIDIDGELMYVVNFEKSGHTNMPAEELKPYKEMKKERNITLTLDKAKEWYKKGGELKEIALQAYSEEELTKVELPKTWEEFCDNYPVQRGECFLSLRASIEQAEYSGNRKYKNWIPSKKSAEAHLAMIQLEQLRDCWRQGWEPTKLDTGYCIIQYPKEYLIMAFNFISFLSFPTKKMAEEFLECFKDLIEKAGDLI